MNGVAEGSWPWLPAAAIGLAVPAAWWLTGRVRAYALARRMLDMPSARGSHAVATPRGGGLSIVAVLFAAMPALAATGTGTSTGLISLAGAGLLVAAVGWLDDRGSLSVRWRLLAQIAAAAWSVGWLGGLPPLETGKVVVDLGWAAVPAAMLFLVWMTNAYNFMDGIDGIAAVQAVTVGAGGALVHSLAVAAPSWQLPLLAAAASLGFLAWNFPRARIFMGDVGSGFLGLLFALVALQAAMVQSALFWAWLVLLGVFVVDATATLLRRVLAGERIFEAHRTHAYQRAARRLGSHVPVTLAVAVINTVWLLPIACLVALERVQAIAGLGVAYLPLLLAWLWSWRRWA